MGSENKKTVQFKTEKDTGLDPENNYTTGIYIDKTLIIKARNFKKEI